MSDKKQLLTESEIRRFMKLANIPVIGKEVVKENVAGYAPPEDGDRQEGLPPAHEETMVHEEEEMEMDPAELGGEEAPEEAPEAGAEMGGAMSAEDLAEKIVDILAAAG